MLGNVFNIETYNTVGGIAKKYKFELKTAIQVN